ncbi:cadmium resistance transporter [Longispora sp. NPDC051575]|uniref:cadmium resistance transporter n=1 Tax=Longispora sp. NPDC051575 TaxID=3154943 RepID=UPI00343F9E42
MEELFRTVAAAVGVFAGTNVDDLLILTVLFLSSRATGRPGRWQIWVGQYLGVGALVAVSALAALGLQVVPDRWVGLLGLVPVGLGVRGLVGAFRNAANGADAPRVAGGWLAVAGVTVANGADNVSVYTPMLRTIGVTEGLVTVGVFAVLVAVWCVAGSWLGSHRRVVAVIERHGHWIVPVVFVVIGAAIIAESGVIGRALALI